MEPGKHPKCDPHGDGFEDVQTPLVFEGVAIDAESELDEAEDCSDLLNNVSVRTTEGGDDVYLNESTSDPNTHDDFSDGGIEASLLDTADSAHELP